MSEGDLGEFSLIELFRVEAEGQIALLTRHLLDLEASAPDAAALESMMRAAHSMKGAARIVGLDAAVRVAHALEDCFVAAQRGELVLGREQTDALLQGVDWLTQISRLAEAEIETWTRARDAALTDYLQSLAAIRGGGEGKRPVLVKKASGRSESGDSRPASAAPAAASAPTAISVTSAPFGSSEPESADRVLRVTADKLDRLLGLAGEALVESRRLEPFGRSLLRLKRGQRDLARDLARLRERLGPGLDDRALALLRGAEARAVEAEGLLQTRLEEIDRHDRASSRLADKIYREARAVRMRPFSDGVRPFARMVRDLARELGKEARLVVTGESTQVDRDILGRLEAPLTHLLRNALDHGLETPEERERSGKPRSGTLRLDARHQAGQLFVTVSDDGRGIDPARVAEKAVARGLTTTELAASMTEPEILEFLFLPGFSLKREVTEISGRGVGLDVVQGLLKEVRGSVRVQAGEGRGASFELRLPVTLSVVRALVVKVAGEPYAVPLSGVARVVRVPRASVASTEGRGHFELEGARVGLASARRVLGLPEETAAEAGDSLAVVVLGDHVTRHGLVVDALLGERELVVQPLDPRLGKVPDVAAGAVLEDGTPALFLDTDDLCRSIERMSAQGPLGAWTGGMAGGAGRRRRRVLVVDDSLTVRELERKLLAARGYEVAVAVDGMEGWNTARRGGFDLVLTDVDMPRLDGIELTKLIKADARLRGTPVMIVSYKDRDEDRRRGLDAGADHYLAKGGFNDDRLFAAVRELIGPAQVEEDGA